ncbi:hypothetical protein IS481_04955 [Caldimonas thermodepolymerans]|uniref:Glycosyl transferase family 41 n=3 Tax=Caldimonas thermodepolymerans TaxID=215580 RepID=A0AA46HVC8_9BURK|nr:hypothetical protein [Caldimonas thermodepolymerans]QPC32519.1 hypothetical protein IS481_04955 [Caldimonas thermodepolymerans]RDH98915.1 glycosyl transferase family 41 [Caldimonas thermodepolymerans]TCP06313.1 glycosyl transferase family 41 [Caldimonas thermodepolymerans]UZG49071.1 hypothetical protein ONS87_05480 [Caldimonas thermodepolymerans]
MVEEAGRTQGAPLSAQGGAGSERLALARQALAAADFRAAADHLQAAMQALPAGLQPSASMRLALACALAATGALRESTDVVRRIAAPARNALLRDPRTDRALAEVLAVGWDAHQVQALLCAYAMRMGRWGYRAGFVEALHAIAGMRAGVPLHRSLVFDAFSFGQPDALVAALSARFAEDRGARPPPPPAKSLPDDGRRVRVALLSGEWRRHPTCMLHRDLVAALDRRRLHLTAIHLDPVTDHHTEDLRSLCDDWLHWPQPDPAAAARAMRERGFDIVWVLGSFQQTPVAEVLVHRPAPLAINGLASYYPHGPALVDYTVIDPLTVPPTVRPHWREALVLLPASAYVLGPVPAEPPVTTTRAALGWPEDRLVLAAPHQAYKLSPECAALWSAVLRRCPDALLWRVQGPALAERHWAQALQAHGVDPARQIVTPPVGWAEHQARLACADLFLDATPMGGHTTLLEALRQGVPAVTLHGPGPAGRIGHALLDAFGLREGCCADAAGYVETVVRWAQDPAVRRRWREVLEARRPGGRGPLSPSLDPARHARWWEALLLHAWQRHRAGLPPASFTVEDQELVRPAP